MLTRTGGRRIGYVPLHFYSDRERTEQLEYKMVPDAPSYCQSGSDRPAKAGPAAHFERNEAQGI